MSDSIFSLRDPILEWKDAARMAQACRDRGGVVVTTNGCFDLLHKGHVTYLAYARQLGDLLIVALNTDASVKGIKGPNRPVNEERARALILSQLKSVDGVCLFSEPTPVEWLRQVRPHIHVKGGDYNIATMPETAALAEWNGRVHLAPFVDGYSTSALIQKSRQS